MDPEKNTLQPKRLQEPEVGDIKDGATHLMNLIIDNDRSYLDLYKLTLSK